MTYISYNSFFDDTAMHCIFTHALISSQELFHLLYFLHASNVQRHSLMDLHGASMSQITNTNLTNTFEAHQ
jgi:heme/copper-type cytochrome/quinol oxidase subunit 4